MTLTIHTIKNEAGGEAVLPLHHRVLQIHRQAIAEAEKEQNAEVSAQIREQADSALRLWSDMATLADTREFSLRPYTWGEKQAARKRATTWSGDKPTFDDTLYYAELVKTSTGLDQADLDALSPGMAAMLIEEVVEISEPSPEKLRFLSSSQPGCEITRN